MSVSATVKNAGDWVKFANQFDTETTEKSEQKIDHELAKIFPVGTALSRSILGDDVDCFVVIRQPFDARFRGFPKATEGAISDCVHELGLDQRRKVLIGGHYTTSGEKAFLEFFQSGESGESSSDCFARNIGFQSCGWFHAIPMGLTPENLIGRRAPDFTLESLTGEPFNLHTSIKDRVAVIAFWGVSCGGCRVEAPHLTALHEKYKEQGLSVIGVNGYDEPRDTVAEYVKDAKLTHTIVMQGGKVAVDKFTVRSYPVTFLVDHDGMIADYHIGFDDDDEKWLSLKVERLLAGRTP